MATKAKTKPNLSLPKVSISKDTLKAKNKEFWQYFIALYGIKGIGKTTMAASFPGFLGIQLEPERDELDGVVDQVHVDLVSLEEQYDGKLTWEKGDYVLKDVKHSPWEYIKAYLLEAAADPKRKGVFIDTIDLAYQCCYDHVCWKAGTTNAKDIGGWADGYKQIAQEFGAVFSRFNQAGKGVIFLSHCKEKEKGEVTVDRKGAVEMTDLFGLSCSNAAYSFVQKACQYVFFMGNQKGKRTVFTRRPDSGEGGIFLSCGGTNRFFHTDGSPIYKISPEGVAPEEGFNMLSAGFHNELDPEEEAPKIAMKKVAKKAPLKKKVAKK